VSKDSDFRQRAFLFSPPPKVVWLRVANATTGDVAALMRRRRDAVADFASDVDNALHVLTA